MSDHVCSSGPYHLDSIVGAADVNEADQICILNQIHHLRFTHLTLNSRAPLMPATPIARAQYIK